MRAILICPDPNLRSGFEEVIGKVGNLSLKSFDAYPPPDAFKRAIRTWGPELIFISIEDAIQAAHLCAQLDSEFSGLPRIALAPQAEPAAFRLALRLKMRELLAHPADGAELARILQEVEQQLAAHPVNLESCSRFYAFLPAKGGVGASTIAAGVSRACKEDNLRWLLADFDLVSGVTGFLFNIDHGFCVPDALRMSHHLDEEAWSKLIRVSGKTELLLSGAPRLEVQGLERSQVLHLLDFIRKTYDVVVADLPDSLTDPSNAVLHEASHIFLVTTPELASLRLARQKVRMLQDMELGGRISLVLNRVQKRMELSTKEVEESVGAPIVASFGSDYAGVTRAVREGECPAGLISSFQRFAERLVTKQFFDEPKTRFVERFALVPLRYTFR